MASRFAVTWTAEHVETLKQCIEDNLSAKECSKRVPHSRASCLGKARRMGLSFHSVAKGPRVKPWKQDQLRGLRDYQSKKRFEEGLKVMPTMPQRIEVITSMACDFWELGADQCRWPLWKDGTPLEDQRYCGVLTRYGPYCVEHFQRSMIYTPRSRRLPVESLVTLKVPVKG